jgi:hypothetical protein
VEGASGRQAVLFDEGAGEVALVFRSMRATVSSGAGCEASEVKSFSLARGRKRRGKAASPGAVLGPPFRGSAVRDLPEVGPRRQTRIHLRLGSPQGIRHRMAALNSLQRSPR